MKRGQTLRDQIRRLRANGYGSATIAKRLQVSERTVRRTIVDVGLMPYRSRAIEIDADLRREIIERAWVAKLQPSEWLRQLVTGDDE